MGTLAKLGGATEYQLLLALIALTPETEEGAKLPLQVALARLDRIATGSLKVSGQ